MLDCRGIHGTGACVVFLLIQSRIICNLHGWPRTQYWMLYVGGRVIQSKVLAMKPIVGMWN